MRWASACAASGDSDGQLEAYRQADDLGDADAAIFLGNALRSRGDFNPAMAAYERAEIRGHREAAMSIGLLLSDIGDTKGAEAAYLRSIALGSTLASLNLGMMLAGYGEPERALVHLRRAAEDGHLAGFSGASEGSMRTSANGPLRWRRTGGVRNLAMRTVPLGWVSASTSKGTSLGQDRPSSLHETWNTAGLPNSLRRLIVKHGARLQLTRAQALPSYGPTHLLPSSRPSPLRGKPSVASGSPPLCSFRSLLRD